MVLPLVKKGDWISFYMGGKDYTLKCFNANPSTVWVEDPKGKIIKLHKLKNQIKLAEKPVEEKEDRSKKTQQAFSKLKKSISINTSNTSISSD